jgi:hypothetical protein
MFSILNKKIMFYQKNIHKILKIFMHTRKILLPPSKIKCLSFLYIRMYLENVETLVSRRREYMQEKKRNKEMIK